MPVAQRALNLGLREDAPENAAGARDARHHMTTTSARLASSADAVVEQHDVRMTRKDGTEIVFDVCIILRFDTDGRIRRIDEYLDSAEVGRLLA